MKVRGCAGSSNPKIRNGFIRRWYYGVGIIICWDDDVNWYRFL